MANPLTPSVVSPMGPSRIRWLAVPVLLGISLLLLVTDAAGHPNGVWRSKIQASKAFFNPGRGQFDDKSSKCRGVGESYQGKYRHFMCLTTRNDGYVFSQYLHTTASGGWAYSEIRVVKGDASPMPTIANRSASGDFATVVTSGHVQKPYSIYVRAVAAPDQLIQANWTAVCTKSGASGISAGSRKGSYRDYSRVDHKMDLPMFWPDECTVGASATLSAGGRLTLKIIAVGQPR